MNEDAATALREWVRAEINDALGDHQEIEHDYDSSRNEADRFFEELRKVL